MRVTNGKGVRKYVYDARMGDDKLAMLCRGDRKLWPTLSDTVHSVVLDVAGVEGTSSWAYWLHALDAVAGGASAECYIRLKAGGREYMLNSTFNRWTLARYDGQATVIFGDNGPLYDKLAVGDVVTAELRVPVRYGVRVSAEPNLCAEADVHAPWLPGTSLNVEVIKGQKRVSAGCNYRLTGLPSGRVHIGGNAQKNGHCRGTYAGVAFAQSMGVINGWVSQYYAGFVPGDTVLRVQNVSYNNASTSIQPVFPGFAVSVRFRVSAVIRHD